MNASQENEPFARLIASLGPWLERVVIIGGWAHRLYRLDPRAQQLDYAAVMTLDTDIAVPEDLHSTGADIRESLIASGFQEEVLGDDQPPATHYLLRDGNTGFYAEFLTPLIGSGYSRRGRRNATIRVAGVVSQRLRHLEVLLNAPWTLNLDESKGFPFPEPKQVRIANPAGFLAHKSLIYEMRNRPQRAKDVLYIHDTLQTFGGHLHELRAEWTKRVRPGLHNNSVRVVERAAETLFGEMDDAIRQAAVIAGGRGLSSEAILEACNLGLRQVFG